MLYIRPIKNDAGGYNPPQSTNVQGLVDFPEEHLPLFNEYNGFVELTIENDVVTGITPDVEAWETWKATLTDNDDPKPASASVYDELAEAYRKGVQEA